MVQTRNAGSTLSYLWPASSDHAGMPVTLPRYFDSDICRAGIDAANGQPNNTSVSTEECAAYQTSNAESCPLLCGDP